MTVVQEHNLFVNNTLHSTQRPYAMSHYSSLPAKPFQPAAPTIILPVARRSTTPVCPTTSLLLGYVVSRLQRIVVREELVRVITILQRIQPRQLPLRVPPQRALVAVPVVDVDLDVRGAGAARGDEEIPRSASNVRGGDGEVAGFQEADVEETGVA